MRGLLSLLTREHSWTDYKTGIFVASSDPAVATLALATVREKLSHVSFTSVAPRSFLKIFPSDWEFIPLEEVKDHPLHSIAELRARRSDLCVVLLPGRPMFTKAKLAAFLLNTRRIFVFNEFSELIPLDLSRPTYLPWHLTLRVWRRAKKMLLPLGFVYLVCRTCWLKLRRPAARH